LQPPAGRSSSSARRRHPPGDAPRPEALYPRSEPPFKRVQPLSGPFHALPRSPNRSSRTPAGAQATAVRGIRAASEQYDLLPEPVLRCRAPPFPPWRRAPRRLRHPPHVRLERPQRPADENNTRFRLGNSSKGRGQPRRTQGKPSTRRSGGICSSASSRDAHPRPVPGPSRASISNQFFTRLLPTEPCPY
jgi:hypothetical protein